MSSELIGALMIAVMLLAIFVGFPISFTLIFLGLAFGYWGFGDLVFYLMTLQFNSVMLEQTLAAVPLFVFMGIMMEQAGLMERLFRSVQLMLASTRGSLYIAVPLRFDDLRGGDGHRRRVGHHPRDHGREDHEPLGLRRAPRGGNDHRRRDPSVSSSRPRSCWWFSGRCSRSR